MKRVFLICVLLYSVQVFAQVPLIVTRDSNAVKELFFAGLREKMNDNYIKAKDNFSKIIGMDPDNDAVLYELAALSYKQNKLQEAEESIKKAVSINADNVWYWKLLAELYKRKGDMDELANVFNQLIRLSPQEDSYYFDRSNALFLSGKMDEALAGYKEIGAKFGSSDALTEAMQRVTLGKGGKASDEKLDSILNQNSGDVKTYLNLSGLLLEKGRTKEALETLKKAKKLDPDNYETDLALADVYQDQKNFTEAINALKNAFKNPGMSAEEKLKIIVMFFPDFNRKEVAQNIADLTKIALSVHNADPKISALYGEVLYRQGNLPAAERQYLETLKLTDQQYAVWEQLMNIQTTLGKYKNAIETGEAALSIYPNQARLYYFMAFALHRNEQNKEAMENIKTAQQLDGENKDLQASILALQGEILIDESKFASANTAFDKAVSLAPKNYMIINNYAYYLAIRNQSLNKAEQLIKEAAAALPQNASIADTYGLVLLKAGRYEEAKSWIEKAIQNNGGDNAVYLEHYGDILSLTGNTEMALENWRQSKALGNDSEKLNKKINEKKYIK